MAIDSDGNIYLADADNHRIQVFGYPANTTDAAPLILVPDDITVDATSTNGTRVDYIVKAIDAQDEILTPICTLESTSVFPAGPNVVTCNVTDSDGNTTTRTFGVTVDIAIDDWVQQVAGFWCNDEITDTSFVEAIQYLVDNGIIIVPASDSVSSGESQVPSWIKQNACYWAEDSISDSEFAQALQWLVTNGIIIL